ALLRNGIETRSNSIDIKTNNAECSGHIFGADGGLLHCPHPNMSASPVTLLDASDTRRRLLQQGLPLAGAGLLLCGIGILASSGGRAWVAGSALVALGVLAVGAAPLVLVSWDLDYKGHRIRFENSPVFGERLYIDGERISQGALGYT